MLGLWTLLFACGGDFPHPLWAELWIRQSAEVPEGFARLYDEPPPVDTVVTLGERDVLTVTDGAITRDLERRTLPGTGLVYHAPVPGSTASSFSFHLELGRGAADADAELPAPFDVVAPAAAGSYRRAEPLPLRWGGEGVAEPMLVRVVSDCGGEVSTFDLPAGDGAETTAVIPAGSLAPGAAGRCDATVVFTRRADGELPVAFDGGAVWGEQVRSVEVELTP